MSAIKLFISYCHESTELDKKVLDLSDKFRANGIESTIDQYLQNPEEGWQLWMLNQINNSDYVLVVCTPSYYDRAVNQPEIGKGVRFESMLSFSEMYDHLGKNNKFIPMVFSKDDIKHIPQPLRPYNYYNLEGDKDFEALYRRLTNQPLIVKPNIGSVQKYQVGTNLSGTTHDMPTQVPTKNIDVTTQSSAITIDVVINKKFEDFTIEDEKALIEAVKANLAIKKDIRIVNLRKGSVIVTLELSPAECEKLYWAIKSGEFNHLGVTDAIINSSIQPKIKNISETDIVKPEELSKSPIKKESGAKLKRQDIQSDTKLSGLADHLVDLTVKEVQELADFLKTEYGIEPTAAAVVITTKDGAAKPSAEEKTSFDIVLKSAGTSKLNVVKIIKDLTGLGLKEAKDLVDGAPKIIKTGLSKAQVEDMEAKLKEGGATTEIV